jgi:hypothetical protein
MLVSLTAKPFPSWVTTYATMIHRDEAFWEFKA